MKNNHEIINDLEQYKQLLISFSDDSQTCNDLFDYYIDLKQYIIENNLNQYKIDKYTKQLSGQICMIDSKKQYSINSEKSRTKFRNLQHELIVIMNSMISDFQFKLNTQY